MMVLRPSHKELVAKIKNAKKAIELGECFFANASKAVGELYNLDLSNKELWEILPIILDEIHALGVDKCYSGQRPPQKSYEQKILERDLFAFAWNSNVFNKKMYFK
jgi:hypothetical protein